VRRQLATLLRRHPGGVALAALVGVAAGTGLSWWALGVSGAVGFLAAVQAVAVALGVLVLSHLVRQQDQLRRTGLAGVKRARTAARRAEDRAAAVERAFRGVRRRTVDRELRRGRDADRQDAVDTALDHYQRALEWHPQGRNPRRAHQRTVLRHLDAVDGTARLVRELDAQTRIENPGYALELAEAAYDRGVRDPDLLDRLIALREHDGRIEDAGALTVPAARAQLRRFDGTRAPGVDGSGLQATRRVMISGYFYSGSGAVKDLLRGVPSTTVWPPAGELRVVKFPGGYADLGRRLSEQGALTTQDLVDHYLHLAGVRVSRRALGRYDRWRMVNADSRRLHDARPTADGYLAALYRGFLELTELAGADELDSGGLEAHTRTVLAAAFDAVAAATGTDRVVVDQIVTAWRIDIARYLPPSTFIIVHRDPRDQFSEVREVLRQPGRPQRKRTPEGFAEAYRADRERVDAWVPRLEAEYGHRVLRLAFEDLVLDHQRTTHQLQETLDLATGPVGVAHFDPDVSRRNVGKYPSHLSSAEVAVLERELAEYLHPGVG